MSNLPEKKKIGTPKHRMKIPVRILADIENMFEDPNETNMEAYITQPRLSSDRWVTPAMSAQALLFCCAK